MSANAAALSFFSSHAGRALALALPLPLSASGCAARSPATLELCNPASADLLGDRRTTDTVEIWLDKHPEKQIAVVGELEAHTLDSPGSIRRMQETAAARGLDGIYWIDCDGPRSGACRAEGFVYLDPARVAPRGSLIAEIAP